MELKIEELDYNYDQEENNFYTGQQQDIDSEEIPENIFVPVKKFVQFTPMNQSIPKKNARMVRPNIPIQKPQISYEDILSKMGMFVSDGKLHLLDGVNKQPQYKQQPQPQYKQQPQPQYKQQLNEKPNIPENSYIYNKYFKEEIQPQNTIRRPKTKNEYKIMLLQDILQKQKIKEIKSRKLVMPTSNINMASSNSSNLNKLFNFPKR